MAFFCCGPSKAKYDYSPPPSPGPKPKPPQQPAAPNLARRKSGRVAPRHKPSKKNIEAFYKEGKELLRAEQERAVGSKLLNDLHQEYAQASIEDATRNVDNLSPYDHMSQVTAWPGQSRRGSRARCSTGAMEQSPADSRYVFNSVLSTVPKLMGFRGYPFETMTDRAGVRLEENTAARKDTVNSIVPVQPPIVWLEDTRTFQMTTRSTEDLVHIPRLVSAPKVESTSLPDEVQPGSQLQMPMLQIPDGPVSSAETEASRRVLPWINQSESTFPSNSESTSGWATLAEYPGVENARDEENIGRAILLQPPTDIGSESDLGHPEYADIHSQESLAPTKIKQFNADDLPALDKKDMGFGSDDLFSLTCVPMLVRLSSSTLAFGSEYNTGNNVTSRALSLTSAVSPTLSRGLSHGSLPRSNRTPSNGTFQRRSTDARRYLAIDSASSIYPASNDGSRPQSLRDSVTDFPNLKSMAQQMAQSRDAPRRSSNQSMELKPYSSASLPRYIESPGFSRFKFPWANCNGAEDSRNELPMDDRPKMLRAAYQSAQPYVSYQEHTQESLLVHPAPLQRRSSTRAVTAPIMGTGSMRSSGFETPRTFDVTPPGTIESVGTTISPGVLGEFPGIDRALRSRSSWCATASEISLAQEQEEARAISSGLPRRSNTIHDTPRGSRDRNRASEQTDDGRFDNLVPSRSGSLTLRKTFTASMQKMREKISLTASSRHSLRSKGSVPKFQQSDAPPKSPEIPSKIDETPDEEPDSTAVMGLNWKRASHSQNVSSTDDVFAGGSRSIRRSSTVHSTRSTRLRRPERRLSAPRRRTTNTRYDDCVVFPFADGHLSNEEEDDYLPRNPAFTDNFLAEEYNGEHRFLMELKKNTLTRAREEERLATN